MARDMYRVRLFIENMGLGMTPKAAARHAGYTNPSRESRSMLADKDILTAIQVIQTENQKNSKLTRENVMENLIEAFDIAKTQGDPQAMVRSMAEVNRMNGFYAPEKKIVELTGPQAERQQQIESLSKEELLELLNREEETPLLEAHVDEEGEYAVEVDAA